MKKYIYKSKITGIEVPVVIEKTKFITGGEMIKGKYVKKKLGLAISTNGVTYRLSELIETN